MQFNNVKLGICDTGSPPKKQTQNVRGLAAPALSLYLASLMQRKVENSGLNQTPPIGVAHLQRVPVGASIENDFFSMSQHPVNVDWDPIQVAERRHSSDFTVGEDVGEVLFSGELCQEPIR